MWSQLKPLIKSPNRKYRKICDFEIRVEADEFSIPKMIFKKIFETISFKTKFQRKNIFKTDIF